MFQTDFWKKPRICLWSLGIFTFLWVLAPSWQHLGCHFLCQLIPSWNILSTDRSELRFESHTGGKIRKSWSWSHTIKGMIEENFQKNRSNQYHVRSIVWLDWPKTTKHFSVNLCKKFLSQHEARRRASKWILFSVFWVAISAICCQGSN